MTTRYSILGAGSVTNLYYLPALRLMGRLCDATVVDSDAHLIGSHEPTYAEAQFRSQDYADYLEKLSFPKQGSADCIVVALPNELHVDAVRMALERGRHVLCEKPLALTATACAQLRALAAEKKCLLKVAMSRRYLPSLMLARDIVEAKELGEVRAIEVCDCTPFAWRPKSFAFFSPQAGGVLADMGVHYLDYLGALIGELKPLTYSDDAKGGIESSLRYRLAAGDVAIEMRLSRLHRSGAYLKIVCERGEIQVDKAKENEVIVAPSGSLSRRVSAAQPFDEAAWPDDFRGSFCQMLNEFERAIDGRNTNIADSADAERAAKLIEWAYERRPHCVPATPVHSQHSPCKVFVTGATGFIGGHLVERLAAEANRIRIAARSPGKCANVSRFPVEIVATDLLDRESVRAAVADARIVYHLAYGNDGKDPARITIDGTKNVVEAAIAAGADCVVVLSTMYVFGFPQSEAVVDESFPYRPYGGEYGSSKAVMERWCLRRAQSSLPTRIVVLNPTCVFGPGGGAYTTLPVDLARKGQFCWIDGGQGFANYNYIENLLDAIAAGARIAQAHGNRFIINDGVVSWRELLGPFVEPVGRNIPSYSPHELERLPRHGAPFRVTDLVAAAISAPEVRAVAGRSAIIRKAAVPLRRFLRGSADGIMTNGAGKSDSSDVPPEWLAALYGPARTTFSASKANDVLGWHPRVALANGQAATLEWLIEDGRVRPPSDIMQFAARASAHPVTILGPHE
jgi:predicted dehydrogenase/nucleoside-diphosphate-sugar epimerase